MLLRNTVTFDVGGLRISGLVDHLTSNEAVAQDTVVQQDYGFATREFA